jgi:amidase
MEEDRELLLPVGLMITGKHFDEASILKVGDAWEQSVSWQDIRADQAVKRCM